MSLFVVVKVGNHSQFQDGMIVTTGHKACEFSDHMKMVFAIFKLPESWRPSVDLAMIESDEFRRASFIRLDLVAQALGTPTLADAWRSREVVEIVDVSHSKRDPSDFLYTMSEHDIDEPDINYISAGTFTIGDGGDYSDLVAAESDIGKPDGSFKPAYFEGDIKLNLISDIYAGLSVDFTQSISGFTFTISSLIEHRGLKALSCFKYIATTSSGRILTRFGGPGTVIYDGLEFITNYDGSGFHSHILLGDTFATSFSGKTHVRNCIFDGRNQYDSTGNFGMIVSHKHPLNRIYVYQCKFINMFGILRLFSADIPYVLFEYCTIYNTRKMSFSSNPIYRQFQSVKFSMHNCIYVTRDSQPPFLNTLLGETWDISNIVTDESYSASLMDPSITVIRSNLSNLIESDDPLGYQWMRLSANSDASGIGTVPLRPENVESMAGSPMTSPYDIGADQYDASLVFDNSVAQFPPEVTITDVITNLADPYGCEIQFIATDRDIRDKCGLYVRDLCTYSIDNGSTWLPMTAWDRSNPKGAHPNHTHDLVPMIGIINTFVWDTETDVGCPDQIKDTLVRIVLTDRKFNSPEDRGIGATNNYIVYEYVSPVGNDLNIGYRVFPISSDRFCINSARFSEDGTSWGNISLEKTESLRARELNVISWNYASNTSRIDGGMIDIEIQSNAVNIISASGLGIDALDGVYYDGISTEHEDVIYCYGGKKENSDNIPFFKIDKSDGSIEYDHVIPNITIGIDGIPVNNVINSDTPCGVQYRGLWFLAIEEDGLLKIMTYGFNDDRFSTRFKGLPLPSNWGIANASCWEYDGWIYILGGSLAGTVIDSFYRIDLDSVLNRSPIIENLNINVTMSSGQIGTVAYSDNHVVSLSGNVSFNRSQSGYAANESFAIIYGGKSTGTIYKSMLIYNNLEHTIESIGTPQSVYNSNVFAYDRSFAIVNGTSRYDALASVTSVVVYDTCVGVLVKTENLNIGDGRHRQFTSGTHLIGGLGDNNLGTFAVGAIHDADTFSKTVFNISTHHSNVWEFGEDKEFIDLETAFKTMKDYIGSEKLPETQIMSGSGRVHCNLDMHDGIYKIRPTREHGIIFTSDEHNPLILDGSTVINKGDIHHHSGNIFTTNVLRCLAATEGEVYEDNVAMAEVFSQVDVETTPSSYYISANSDLYIHSTLSDNVRSNGLKYSVSHNILPSVISWDAVRDLDDIFNISFDGIIFENSFRDGYCIDFSSENVLTNESINDGLSIHQCQFPSASNSLRFMSSTQSIVLTESSFFGDITSVLNQSTVYMKKCIVSDSIINVNAVDMDNTLIKRSVVNSTNITIRESISLDTIYYPSTIVMHGCAIASSSVGTIINTASTVSLMHSTIVLSEDIFDSTTLITGSSILLFGNIIHKPFSVNIYSQSISADPESDYNIIMNSGGVDQIDGVHSLPTEYNKVFSSSYIDSYSIELLDIYPLTGKAKNKIPMSAMKTSSFDLLGGQSGQFINIGCMQSPQNNINSSKWPPLWLSDTAGSTIRTGVTGITVGATTDKMSNGLNAEINGSDFLSGEDIVVAIKSYKDIDPSDISIVYDGLMVTGAYAAFTATVDGSLEISYDGVLIYSNDISITQPRGSAVITSGLQPITSVTIGLSAELIVTAINAIGYRWFRNGLIINDQYSDTYSFVGSNGTDKDEITVEAYGHDGDDSSSTEISLLSTPLPVITGHPADITVLDGATATFNVTAIGSITGYQWYENGLPIVGETSDSLSFTATTSQSGSGFTCIVSGPVGFTESDFGNLIVNTVPRPDGTVDFSSATLLVGTILDKTYSVVGAWDYAEIFEDTEYVFVVPYNNTQQFIYTPTEGPRIPAWALIKGPGGVEITSGKGIFGWIDNVVHPQSQTVNVGDTVTFTSTADTPYDPDVIRPGVSWEKDGVSIRDIDNIPINETSYSFTAQISDNGSQIQSYIANNFNLGGIGSASKVFGYPSNIATLTVLP